jgi:hypothetical protein
MELASKDGVTRVVTITYRPFCHHKGMMDHAIHNSIINFIWGIADDVLRDVYIRGKYRDVILPMVVTWPQRRSSRRQWNHLTITRTPRTKNSMM